MTPEPANPVPVTPPAWWRTDPARVALYAVVLVAVGGWACFSRLNDGMLVYDESVFALTSQLMLETGDYVVLRTGDPYPHLNAVPLYNWLTCLTAGVTPDAPIRYRLWAGIFGVLCGLAVLLLGTELFRPEVGFVAGLFLLLDHNYLFNHAARSGVVETGLMTFITLMAYCYLRAARPGATAPVWWLLAGVCLGGAALIKPPVIGLFFFSVLSALSVATRRDVPFRTRLGGPALVLAVGLALAGPWYALVTDRLGPRALRELLIFNSVGRVKYHGPGMVTDPWLYVSHLWRTPGIQGKLFWPALGIGAALAAAGWLRRGWLLPVACAGLYVPAISTANIKFPHYLHFALPFLCVLAAAVVLVGLLPRPASLSTPRAVRGWRALGIAGVLFVGVVLWYDVKGARRNIRTLSWDYPPLLVERAAEPGLRGGEGTLVLFRFPAAIEDPVPGELGFGIPDRFYTTRLSHVRHVSNRTQLNAVLAEGKPTVVVLPPEGVKTSDLVRKGLVAVPDRAVRIRAWHLRYPVVVFNRAEERLGLTRAFVKSEPVGD